MEFFNVDYNEFIVIYPDERRISPDSMYLQLTTPLEWTGTSTIYISSLSILSRSFTKMSSCLLSCPSFPDIIRFPTWGVVSDFTGGLSGRSILCPLPLPPPGSPPLPWRILFGAYEVTPSDSCDARLNARKCALMHSHKRKCWIHELFTHWVLFLFANRPYSALALRVAQSSRAILAWLVSHRSSN